MMEKKIKKNRIADKANSIKTDEPIGAKLPFDFTKFKAGWLDESQCNCLRTEINGWIISKRIDNSMFRIGFLEEAPLKGSTCLELKTEHFDFFIYLVNWSPKLALSASDICDKADEIFQSTFEIEYVIECLKSASGIKKLIAERKSISKDIRGYIETVDRVSDALIASCTRLSEWPPIPSGVQVECFLVDYEGKGRK
jgi:hypothetical protein